MDPEPIWRSTSNVRFHEPWQEPEQLSKSRKLVACIIAMNASQLDNTTRTHFWESEEACPPTSMYSAYNVIPGQKKLLLALETGHNNIPEQVAEVQAWLQAFLKTASAGN